MTEQYNPEILHQNSGQEYGQGFQLLEESENWTDNDALYELNIWGETVGYARVTRDTGWDMFGNTWLEEDALEEELEQNQLYGDLFIERANDLDEAPVINNGDQEITESGESYQIFVDNEFVGEAVMAGDGLQEEFWRMEDDYTGQLEVTDSSENAPGQIRF